MHIALSLSRLARFSATRIGLMLASLLLLLGSAYWPAQAQTVGTTVARRIDPNSVFVDASGNLYVTDVDRIVKFPPNSTSLTTGTTVAGGSLTQLKYPSGSFCGHEWLYLCSRYE